MGSTFGMPLIGFLIFKEIYCICVAFESALKFKRFKGCSLIGKQWNILKHTKRQKKKNKGKQKTIPPLKPGPKDCTLKRFKVLRNALAEEPNRKSFKI